MSVFLALLVSMSFAQLSAVIQGSVVDDVTGLPVSGVQITLYAGSGQIPPLTPSAPLLPQNDKVRGDAAWFDASGNQIPPPQAVVRLTYTASTDSSGKFAFSALGPGDYRLAAVADGYVPEEYRNRRGALAGTPVTASIGGNATVIFRLTPSAILSGSVVDPDRLPVPNLPMYLLRTAATVDGSLRFRVEKETTTGKEGLYRFDAITAGHYYIAAGRFPTLAPAQHGLTPYAFTFYPGVSEAIGASVIDLFAGTQMQIDTLVVSPQELRKLRGRIIETRTGKPPAAATVTLLQTFPFDRPGRFSTEILAGLYDPQDGTFSFAGLIDGTYYRLGVNLPDIPHPSRSMFSQSFDAYLTFELAGSDRDDLIVWAPTPASAQGK